MEKKYLLIGEVIKPQGIKGEVKLRAESEDLSRYERLETVYLLKGSSYLPCRVVHGRASGGFAYLQLEGIAARNAAEALRGTLVYVDRKDAIVPGEGKYFICDLVGCRAWDDHGTYIGELKEVLSPNSICDVYRFETERGEMMMPALKKAILSVDIDEQKIILSGDILKEIALWPDSPEIVEE